MATTQLREPKSYGKATKSTGPDIPAIDDDNYRALVKDVKEGDSFYGGSQFVVEFELLDEKKANGDLLTLRGYIKIPDGVINDGTLNENSKLYEFLKALGYTDDNIEIEPADWQGEELRIVVKNTEVKEGENKGQVRPKVTGYLAKKGSGRQQAEQARKSRGGDEEDF